MNLINKILLGCLLLVGLVGCGAGEVPPSPDAPGGVAGEYSVALDELGSWANEAVTLSVSPDILTEGIEQDQTIEIEDTFIWSTFYVYHFKTGEWAEGVYEDPIYKNTGWIQNYAHIFYDDNIYGEDSVGDYIVATYSCTKDNSDWDCHGGWQVEGYTVEKQTLENLSIGVDVLGTTDDSKIILELAGNEVPYTDIEIVIELNENFFNVAESGGTYDKQAYNSAARSTPEEIIVPVHENNFNESPITLYGAWNQDGAYDISVYARAINYDEQSAKSTHVGEISLTLPDLPGAVGAERSEEVFDIDLKNVVKAGFHQYGFYLEICMKNAGTEDFPYETMIELLNSNGDVISSKTWKSSFYPSQECRNRGATFVSNTVHGPIYDEHGIVRWTLDPNNLLSETNEDNNVFTFTR